MIDLAGAVVCVTGGARGIGKATATELARRGAKVVIGDLDADEAARSAAEIGARSTHLDVTDPESLTAFRELAGAEGPPAMLVNNAGIVVTKPSLKQTEADWDQVMDVNLKGAFFVAQACAQHMADGSGGAIVNIASLLGERVSKTEISYCVSKAGLAHMTKALAYEWAKHGIRVNAISPGYVKTDLNRAFLEGEMGQTMMRQIPIRRFGEPEDLDGALLYLLSDLAAWTTGHILTVDGGHSLATP